MNRSSSRLLAAAVKGLHYWTATDLDGNYVLKWCPEEATLVFNYLGIFAAGNKCCGTIRCQWVAAGGHATTG